MQTRLAEGIYMIQGTATRDAEYKVAGQKNTKITSFSLAIDKRDGNTIYANCKTFGRLALYAADIRKADSVCCIGRIEEREYNGKTYRDFMCDWLSIAALNPSPAAAYTDEPQPQASQYDQDDTLFTADDCPF